MTTNIEVTLVTPAIASQLLTRNDKNRPLRQERVRSLARDMKEGRWRFNGAAIVVDLDGNLLDGQHRLAAIVESGLSFEMTMARDVDLDIFDTIDAGVRRKGADVLAIAGIKSAISTAATLRMISWYRSGQPHFQNFRLSNAGVAEAHRDYADAAEIVGTLFAKKGLRQLRANAPFYAAMREAYLVNRSITDEFIEGVSDGAELSRGDPRLTYREWMINRTHRKVTLGDMVFHITVKAWNAFAAGRKVSTLKMVHNETLPRLNWNPSKVG